MSEKEPQNPLQPPAEQRPSQEREIDVEKIMEKVQDINAKGTAHSQVFDYDLPRIFSEGILADGTGTATLREWALKVKAMRKDSDNLASNWESMGVFMNIVGRSEEYLRPYNDSLYSVDIIFGMDEFHESNQYDIFSQGRPPTAKTYYSNQSVSTRDEERAFHGAERRVLTFAEMREKMPWLFDESGRKSNYIMGYFLSYNVPRRNFKGIVINPRRSLEADNFVKTMRASELALPVYSYDGNLLWPRQMSYEEVKKFVAEREAKKYD